MVLDSTVPLNVLAFVVSSQVLKPSQEQALLCNTFEQQFVLQKPCPNVFLKLAIFQAICGGNRVIPCDKSVYQVHTK